MPTLKDFEEQTKALIKEENWPQAYKLCNQILSYDTENIKFIKLKKYIEKEIASINQRAIKEQIENLEPLLKEKKYAEYLKAIAPLQSFVKEYPEIGTKIVKAKKLLDKQYQDKRDAIFNEVSNEIKSKKDTLDFNEVMLKLNKLYKLGIHKTDVQKLGNKLKNQHIKKQIKENLGLINSQKFEDTIIFLLKLKKLDEKKRKSHLTN
jgi:hypothetical protein